LSQMGQSPLRERSSGTMGPARPKLWIVGGHGVPIAELQARLGESFDIAVLPAAPLADRGAHQAQLLIVSPDDLRKLTAAPTAASALLDSVGQGVCLMHDSGEVVWSNTRFERYDAKVREQVLAVCREAVQHFQEQAAHGPVPHQTTRRVEITAEEGKAYEVIVSPAANGVAAQDPSRKVETVAAIVRDVTGDRRLRQKMDAIDQAGAELVRFEAESVRKMNVFERLRLLETKIVRLCKELLRYDHFSIRLIDDRSGRLEIVISTGLPQEAIELEIYPSPEGNGISGFVAATGRSYICYDTEQDPRFLPGLAGARASLTIPLRLHDKVIGVFNIESQQVGAFTEDDRQFAEIFARYVAIALNMLNLLVVERSATNESVSGRVEGELSEPLTDILREADWLKDLAERDPEAARHIERIRSDVDAIRRRVKNVCTSPQTLLGVEGALADRKKDPMLEGRRVLVADDEANVRRIIHDVLHNRGCEVITAESGGHAIELLEQVAAGQVAPFQAVLSDIRMPDRNGYEVFAAVRRCCPGLPVILMTGFGYDPHHSIVRASQEGLQSVLFKPFPVDRLLDEVRKAVAPK
jgi:two-component system, sensor histidine kinase SagS